MFVGAMTALVTPMRDGQVDEAALEALVEWQIAEGIDALIPVGTTGESATLDAAEHVRVIKRVVKATRKRVPVIAGAGANATAEAISLSKEAHEAGADALLQVTPYYNRPTQEGLYLHFRAIAEATPLPIVLYNVPGRTGVNMSADTTIRLSELRNIVAIKEHPELPQMSMIISGAREDFIVLSGDDPVTVAAMAIGARGVVSVASNEAPAEMAQIVELCEKGDFAAARKLHHWLLPLIQVNFVETNPLPCKAAMAAMGLIEENFRLPLVPPSAATRNKVVQVLQNLKMLGAAARA
jgi:4-hydroxy-tetrahydrodipicolinate synthase